MLLPFTIAPAPADGDPPSGPVTPRVEEPYFLALASGMRPPPPDRTEHMRAVLAALPIAVVALDFEGRVTLWSAAAQALFGWNEEEALGRVAASEMCALARDAIGGKTVLDVRMSPMRSDGERVDVSASIVPLRDGDAVMGAVAVFTRV